MKEPAKKPVTLKVGRETAGRRGKGVTTVFDLPLDDDGVRELAVVKRQLFFPFSDNWNSRWDDLLLCRQRQLDFPMRRWRWCSGAAEPTPPPPTSLFPLVNGRRRPPVFRLLRLLRTVAGDVQLHNHAMMHQAVDRRCRRHGVFEDRLPARER